MSGEVAPPLDPPAHWRIAEKSIGDPDAVERAAAKLSPREAMALRAMNALHCGLEPSIREVAEAATECGMLDIAAALELALGEEGTRDATTFRARLSQAGVRSDAKSAKLDVLAGWARWRAGGKINLPRKLSQLRRSRPALDIAIELLRRKKSPALATGPRREAWWRTTELSVVALCQTAFDPSPLDSAKEFLGELRENWNPEQWPDLGRHRSQRDHLLQDPNSVLSQRIGQQLARDAQRSSTERKRLLGAVLQRIERGLREGRPRVTPAWVQLALELSKRLQGFSELEASLAVLEVKLSRISEGAEDGANEFLLEQLWKDSNEFPRDARRCVAKAIHDAELEASGFAPSGFSRATVRTAVLFLIRTESDPAEQRQLAIVHSDRIDLPAIERVLPDTMPAVERSALIGHVALHMCQTERVLEEVERLLELDGRNAATQSAELASSLMMDEDSHLSGRRLKRLGSALGKLGEREIEPEELFQLYLDTEQAARTSKTRKDWRAKLAPSLQTIVAAADDPDRAVNFEYEWLALVTLGRTDEAEQRLREFGRSLRAAASNDTKDIEVLRMIGALQRGSDDADLGDPIRRALPALSAFAARRGGDHVRSVLRSAPELPPGVRVGLLAWACENTDRLGRHDWQQLLMPELGEFAGAMGAMMASAGAELPEELRAFLDGAFEGGDPDDPLPF